jgi:3-phytase
MTWTQRLPVGAIAGVVPVFATTGLVQDREGVGIYTRPNGTGYIVAVDQLPGESVFHVYKREGEPGRPHDHSAELLVFKGGADGTDGLVVAMNSTSKNFLFYRWPDIAAVMRTP